MAISPLGKNPLMAKVQLGFTLNNKIKEAITTLITTRVMTTSKIFIDFREEFPFLMKMRARKTSRKVKSTPPQSGSLGMTLRIKVQHKRSKVKKKKKIQIQIQVDETFEGIESDQGLQIISNRRAKKFTDIGKSEKGAR